MSSISLLSSRRKAVCFSAVALFTLLATPAFAQTAADVASARALVSEGRAARDRGELTVARDKFRAAHALLHAPITGLDLAKAEVALGHLIDAREICLEIEHSEKNPRETKASAQARSEALALAATLDGKLAALSVRVSRTAALRVTVDDREIPVEALGTKRRLDPGPHRVVAQRTGGDPQEVFVTLAEGENREITLDPPEPVVAKVVPPPVIVPPPPVVERRTSPLVPIGGAVLAGGVVIGATAGLFALRETSRCDAHMCPNSGTISRAKTWATVSTIGFAAGGVGAVLLGIGLASPKEVTIPGTALSVRPSISAEAGGGLFRVSGVFQ